MDLKNRAGQGLSQRRLISRTSSKQGDIREVSHHVKINGSAEQLLAGSV
jgi:hypothetical protein